MDQTQPTANAPSGMPEQPAAGNPSPQPMGGMTTMEPKSMMKRYGLLGGILLLVLLAGAGAYWYLQSGTSTPTTFKIGALLPYTGGGAGSGFGELKGAQLAKKQLGASNIEIIQADTQCDPAKSPDAIKSLIAQGVVAIIGDACSGASLAALPDADSNKIPMISASASSPELSKPGDYFFRVVPPDQFQGKFAATTIYGDKYTKVAVLHTNESYGNALAKVFSDEFKTLGGTVVYEGKFKSDSINLEKQINEAKAKNPQAIYLVANSSPTAVAAMKLARNAGLNAPIYGSDAIYDKIIVNNAGSAAEGLTVTAFPIGTQAFKQAFINDYQTEEQAYAAAQAYDCFQAIYNAIKNGAKTGEEIKNQLSSMSFDGVSGKISFDENGEISSSDYKYGLFRVKDGNFTPVE